MFSDAPKSRVLVSEANRTILDLAIRFWCGSLRSPTPYGTSCNCDLILHPHPFGSGLAGLGKGDIQEKRIDPGNDARM
jgi:hypothetical protein